MDNHADSPPLVAVYLSAKYMKKLPLLLVAATIFCVAAVAQGYTREEVVKRGHLRCGVSTGTPGFSSVDEQGRWAGLDVDLCRGVAAAVLGNADLVEFQPLAENEAFSALLTGDVDLLSRHLAWSFTEDTALAVQFAGILYYDGQGFLVAKKHGAKTARDLKKIKVCSVVNSPFKENLVDFLQRSKTEYKLVPFGTLDQAVKGFDTDQCDLVSLPQSQLYGVRMELAVPDNAEVLRDVISKEPLGPVVRQGDDIWVDIVRWTLYAMINGEELGITSQNVDDIRISNDIAVRRFFGLEKNGAIAIGLNNDWAARIIAQVGNYGEVYDRNIGQFSRLKIDRGLNRLWTQGGLQYAPPIR
jgi:general L-amino acid transport system substrate-binding protein